jgi:hypothetical protein
MDEGQLVELPSGVVLASMRPYPCAGSFGNSSQCGFRTFSRSSDQGATFGPVIIDRKLPSPACMGSVFRSRFDVGDQRIILEANPTNKTHRQNGKIRRTEDGVEWDTEIPVWKGAFAYSALTDVPAAGRIGLLWETDGPQCAAGGSADVASCRMVFSSFALKTDEAMDEAKKSPKVQHQPSQINAHVAIPDSISTAVVTVDWADVAARTPARPTVHVPLSWAFQRTDAAGRTNPLHAMLFERLAQLNTTHTRMMLATDTNGLNDIQTYPEPTPPTHNSTSWNLSGITNLAVDFCAATSNCTNSVMYIGPTPPWFFCTSPTDKTVCSNPIPSACSGSLIDPSGRAAGEYYSRIVSWLKNGEFKDELGKLHTGGPRLGFKYWEVLNEANDQSHYKKLPSTVATYTKLYDGITSVIKRDHPTIEFAAMAWTGIWRSATVDDFRYFYNRSNHEPMAPWPPALATFHGYTGMPPGLLSAPPIANTAAAFKAIKELSPQTELFMDELGSTFPCAPATNWSTILDGQPGRFDFWNPAAAWMAAMWAKLATIVSVMLTPCLPHLN